MSNTSDNEDGSASDVVELERNQSGSTDSSSSEEEKRLSNKETDSSSSDEESRSEKVNDDVEIGIVMLYFAFPFINDLKGPITTKKELWGWYFYDWANSPWLNNVLSAFMPTYLTTLAQENMTSDGTVAFMGSKIQPTSYYQYVIAISVVLQVFSFIAFGAMADFGANRKRMLIISGLTGSIACMLFFVLMPSTLWLGAVLLVIGNICFGVSVVFYNSFLPLLVKNHPRIRSGEADEEEQSRIDHNISTKGFAMGYVGGVILLVINVVTLTLLPTQCQPLCKDCPSDDTNICPEECGDYTPEGCDNNYWGYRTNLASVGVWWFVFGMFTYFWVQNRKSAPLPEGKHYFTESLGRVWRTIKRVKKLPHTFKFLLSFWFYMDGVQTIMSGAALLAVQEVGMNGLEVGIAVLEANLASLVGNYLFLFLYTQSQKRTWLQRNEKPIFNTKIVIMINLFIITLVPIYARLPGTLKSSAEFYVLAGIYGLQVGSIQSFSRVLYARVTPAGQEAEFFSFYEITDKGSSWIGPLIMAGVNDATKDLRWGVMTVIVLFVAGFTALLFVDEEKGKEDARLASDKEFYDFENAAEGRELAKKLKILCG